MSPTLENEVFGGAPAQETVDAAISAQMEKLGAGEIDRFLDAQIANVEKYYDTNPPERFAEYCAAFRNDPEVRAQIAFALSNVRQETGLRLETLMLEVQRRVADRWLEYKNGVEKIAIQVSARTERILSGMEVAA